MIYLVSLFMVKIKLNISLPTSKHKNIVAHISKNWMQNVMRFYLLHRTTNIFWNWQSNFNPNLLNSFKTLKWYLIENSFENIFSFRFLCYLTSLVYARFYSQKKKSTKEIRRLQKNKYCILDFSCFCIYLLYYLERMLRTHKYYYTT